MISSNPDEPEMYELQCQNPQEKRIWIDTIGAAVAWRNVFLAEIKASSSETFLFSAPFGSGPATLAKFQHNQLLEELRNLQDRLSKEKAEWIVQEHISEQRKQLLKPQEQVRIENTDIQQ